MMRADGVARAEIPDEGLFARIGAFLALHRLGPDPAHYNFAHTVLADPTGPLARAVDQLSDGGVRLSRQDIERLGGTVLIGGSPMAPQKRPTPPAGDTLVIEARAQVDGFADMVRAIHDETREFGRDLAASAAAISDGGPIAGLDEIARITGAMIARIHDAEVRLATATAEADGLREKLAEAHDHARRDSLTGLPNRRAFDELEPLASLDEGPHCLAVCDIDRFKRINDKHGHAVGDRVLRAIAQTLDAECAGHDAYRLGGEEFVIILRNTPLVAAAGLLDRVRESLSIKRFRDRETGAPLGQITLSAGVTALQIGERLDQALARADTLLYDAKAQGRDRVSAA